MLPRFDAPPLSAGCVSDGFARYVLKCAAAGQSHWGQDTPTMHASLPIVFWRTDKDWRTLYFVSYEKNLPDGHVPEYGDKGRRHDLTVSR